MTVVDEVARRYADALFSAARGTEEAQAFAGELRSVVDAVAAAPALHQVVVHPMIPPAAKIRVMDRLFGEALSPPVRRLLETLFANRRGGALAAVAEALERRVDEARGLRRALVRSVTPLGAEDLAAIRRALSRRLGGEVELSTEADPALLGGLEIRVGGRVLDLSVARRLRELRRRLLAPEGSRGAVGRS